MNFHEKYEILISQASWLECLIYILSLLKFCKHLGYLCSFKPYLRHMKCFICYYKKKVYLLIIIQGIGERLLNNVCTSMQIELKSF